jgi:hypothetical protein
LRAPIFDRPAPIPVGDAVIIDDNGNVLLIRRAGNHQWAMPVYQFIFPCRPLNGSEPVSTPSHAKVLNARWFAGHNLPDDLDPGHVPRIPEAFRVWRGDGSMHFDR